MTREEAIKHLYNDWFKSLGGQICVDSDKSEQYLEAIGMAISALRAQQEAEMPLSAFLAPMDFYEGLKRKFLVFKSDTGEMVENCFVLRPDKDPAAVAALRAYAAATDNDTLSADIINWVGAGNDRDNSKPLTLDELREMAKRCEGIYVAHPDGSPVLRGQRYCAAVLVPFGNTTLHIRAICDDRLTLWEGEYGKTWLAYRRKPEEGTI